MKKLLLILGVLFALAVVGVVVVLFSLGAIVKTAVNTAGPRITQTTVELKEAKLSPFSGSGTLRGLSVGNPEGWTTERAFFLKEISIALEPKSLKSDHIVIHQILIDQPEITYETRLTTSNLQDLLKNIQGEAQKPQPAPETKEEKPAEPAKEIKIEIKSFRFVNGTILLAGAGQSYTVPMPDIVLENLGTKEGGLTPEQLSMVIVREITAQAVKAGLNAAAKKGLMEKAGEGLRGLLGGKK